MSAFKTLRHFAAPPAAVFAALAAPDRLARWWGPDGFANTFDVFDFQPDFLPMIPEDVPVRLPGQIPAEDFGSLAASTVVSIQRVICGVS